MFLEIKSNDGILRLVTSCDEKKETGGNYMTENAMKELILELANDCESYMDLYIRAHQYGLGDDVTYDEFVEWLQEIADDDEILTKDDDFSRVTAKVKIGSLYIDLKAEEQRKREKVG